MVAIITNVLLSVASSFDWSWSCFWTSPVPSLVSSCTGEPPMDWSEALKASLANARGVEESDCGADQRPEGHWEELFFCPESAEVLPFAGNPRSEYVVVWSMFGRLRFCPSIELGNSEDRKLKWPRFESREQLSCSERQRDPKKETRDEEEEELPTEYKHNKIHISLNCCEAFSTEIFYIP